MKRIRTVQIGLSHAHAFESLYTLLELSDIFEVVGVVIPEDDPPSIWRSESEVTEVPFITLEEALADSTIEAAVIETFELNLTKYALMFAEKGCAIQMDKPGSADLPGFERLIGTVKEKRLVFHTGYMYRYNPAIMMAKEMLERGELGDVSCVETHMDCYHTKERRQWMEAFPGGMMFFLGCHLVDLIAQFMGFPKEVIPFNTPSMEDGVTAPDIGFAVLKYENGIAFAKTAANEKGGFRRRQLVIVGSKATLEIKPIERYGAGGIYTDYTLTTCNGWGEQPTVTETAGPFHRYKDMFRAFAKMVRGEAENPYTYDYELELYRTVLKACGEKTK